MARLMKKSLVLMVAILLIVESAFAVSVVRDVRLNQIRQNGGDISMYVSVQDADSAPCIGNYSAKQFDISVDGLAVVADSIQRFDHTTQGIHYVFSIDISRTLNAKMMQNIREAIIPFVENLAKQDRVTIITFGNDVKILAEYSSNKTAIIDAVEKDVAARDGNTALYKGVVEAIKIAHKHGGRSAVIMISDGEDDASPAIKNLYTEQSIYDEVIKMQIPLFCLGLNDRNGANAASLEKFANETGGNQYIITTDLVGKTLTKVKNIMENTLILNAKIYNTQNKAGFDEVSAFKVGFDNNGEFITSNEIKQNINWRNVPVPTPTPTPVPTATPIPQISLELDNHEVTYISGGYIYLTGEIEVDQGFVAQEDLMIVINGENWSLDANRNGNGYTFAINGIITDNTRILEVQAKIRNTDIASRIERVQVIIPTPAPVTPVPTATPAPILSLEIDNRNDIVMELGNTITFTGAIDVQGEIDYNKLIMYINGVESPMVIQQINRAQYGFTTDYRMTDSTVSEITIQIKYGDEEIYTRIQRIPVVTPTPTPNPELELVLNNASVMHVPGNPVVITGDIEITSGIVSPNDLALFVNNEPWPMDISEKSKDVYAFTATGSNISVDISLLDVRVKLNSNNRVGSGSQKLVVTSPTPTAEPDPTRRAVVTPPPSPTPTPTIAIVTVEPTAIPEAESFIAGFIKNAVADGSIWYIGGGAVLVLLLIIVLVIILIIRASKKKNQRIETTDSGSTNFTTEERDWKTTSSPTRREEEGEETIRNENNRESQFVSDDPAPDYSGSSGGANGTSTLRIDNADEANGTVRIDVDEEVVGGTQRIEEEIPSILLKIDEIRNGECVNQRVVRLEAGGELVLGRFESTDLCIGDKTVSGRHMGITYDGDSVFVEDIGSTNGTKLNGEQIQAREKIKIESGDSVLIGKTTLKIALEEVEMF
ncbi:MAG: FHA domain-containing protein [Clostridia bacterium]|nr:FHA domain-containing protein [Clostridia bacterium]